MKSEYNRDMNTLTDKQFLDLHKTLRALVKQAKDRAKVGPVPEWLSVAIASQREVIRHFEAQR